MRRSYTAEWLSADQRPQWDAFVDQQPQGTIFHRSEWLTAMDGRVSFLVARDGQGQIVAGVPLVPGRLGWYRTYRPPIFCRFAGAVLSQPRGAKLISQHTEQKAKALALLEGLGRADWVRFPLHVSNGDAQPYVWHGFGVTVSYTYRISGGLKAEEAWSQITSAQRSAVRKAQKLGIQVRAEDKGDVLLDFVSKTFQRQKLPRQEALVPAYARGIETALRLGRGTVYVARDPQGVPHAASLVVWDPRTSYHILHGGNPDLRSSGAGSLVVWQCIQDALGRGQTFDFEGSTIPGVELHYRLWGGQLCPYLCVERVTSRLLGLLVWRQRRKQAREIQRMFARQSPHAESAAEPPSDAPSRPEESP